ncbi:MAG: DUF4126 family protein [Longimicrobiales bacterium]|nr:DUF4126 family protein [Longimicrobiales bacterium]
MSHRLLAAAGLGAVTGLRSMSGLALASRELAERPSGDIDAFRRWLADDTVSTVLTGLAIAELAADKLPEVPDRVDPAPLVARGVLGAAVGAIAAGEERWAAGAAIGATTAVLSAWVGWAVRKEAGWATGLPDPILAVMEDAIAIATGRGSAELL